MNVAHVREDIVVPSPLPVRSHLERTFTLPNPKFEDARRQGRWTRGIDPTLRYFRYDADGGLHLPRGAREEIEQACRDRGVCLEWRDETHVAQSVEFTQQVTLTAAQEGAVEAMLRHDTGVLEAPAGGGKTVMAMALIARRRQPTLFIVHTRELAQQAIATAGTVLGMSPDEIGMVGGGRRRVGQRLTIGMVQTLARGIPADLQGVGHVVADESHHCPAEQMARVISQFPARYMLGLTATPYRRDGLDAVIGFYLGPIRATIGKEELQDRLIHPTIVPRDTGFRPQGAEFHPLIDAIVASDVRNGLIVQDVAKSVRAGWKCLVLSDRVDHVERLAVMLGKAGIAAAALHGELDAGSRGQIMVDVAAGTISTVVATAQLVGEGWNCPPLNALFLATPVSFSGRITQYVGRVSRTAPGKARAFVVDYRDDHAMLWSSWGKRFAVYREEGLAVRYPRRRAECA